MRMIDIFGYKFKSHDLLIAIVIGSAVLRFWGLGSAEVFHDEGFYAFRSIGYLDYIQNDSQTTPVQWFADSAMPFWSSLSFHDHPPLYFLIQNIFFRLFGDSLFVARLPSVLAGLGSIILLYFIARKLFKDESVGLLASLILGLSQIHIWISRSALMESLQILAILTCLYLFLEFLDDSKKWLWFGVALGVSFLVKYTSAFLLPVFGILLLVRRREIFLQKELWMALLVAATIFSPVLIYNLNLYTSVGHFDLQLAYLFRQAAVEWQASVGKVQEPFSNIGGNMLAMYSIPFLILVIAGLVLAARKLFERKSESFSAAVIAVGSVVFMTLMFLAVGSAYRFLALYVPFFVILIVFLFLQSRDFIKEKNTLAVILALFLIYELFFSVDGIFLNFPDFGVVKLDQYFDRAFDGQRPSVPPHSSNVHLEKIIQENLNNYPKSATPSMLIYDENMGLSSRLWVFTRRIYYHGIPSVTTGQFKALLRSSGADSLKDYKIYFVKASQYTSINPYFSTPDAADFEVFLQQSFSAKPAVTITGYNSLPMFDVYEFTM